MGLGNLFGRREESRAVSYQSVWGAGGDWNAMRSWTGNTVTYDTALTLATVYACVRLLVDDVSTLPADTFIRKDGNRVPFRPKPMWVTEPDTGYSMADHLGEVVLSMLLTHGACVRVYRNDVGDVVALVALDPMLVEPKRNPRTGEVEYEWNNGQVTISARDMIYLPMLRRPGTIKGVSPLDELKQSLGMASALDEFAARFFSGSSSVGGVIETQAALSPDQAKVVKDAFEATHKGTRKAHGVAVIGGGSKFVKTSSDPEQAQMLESRRFQVEEIARIFRIPLHMLQVAAPGVQSYSSNEQNEIQYATHTLRPIVTRIETAYSRLIYPADAFLRFNMDALQRGDIATRFSAYAVGTQSGFMNINRIHRLEDWEPVEGGDVYRVPLANVDLAAAGLTETKIKVDMAQRLVLSGFDPAATMSALGLPDIEHTGLPSAQLQQVQMVDPENPDAVYPAK